MTPEDIVTKFLRIGAGKGSLNKIELPEETGYFGMAKVALMSCEYWSCRTLDWLVSSRHVEDQREITQMPRRLDGTRICVGVDTVDKFWCVERALKDLLSYLITSESSVDLTVKEIDKTSSTMNARTALNLNTGGLSQQNNIVLAHRDDENQPGFTVSIVSDPPVLPLFEMFENTMGGDDLLGVFVRLNGLTQYEEWVSNGLTFLLIVDVVNCPNSLPPDSYPFNMSRESLKGKFNCDVHDAIKSFAKNPETTKTQSVNNFETSFEAVDGILLEGVSNLGVCAPAIPNHLQGKCCTKENALCIAPSATKVEDSTMVKAKMLFEKLSRSSLAGYDWRVLMAWGEILRLVEDTRMSFGIGLTGDKYTKASRIVYEGTTYYLLNPNSIKGPKTHLGKLLCMWHLALHEVTHSFMGVHDEYFAIREGELASICADHFEKAIPRLLKVFEGKASPSWLEKVPVIDDDYQRSLF
ncbi:MAG: hypothetical protein H0S82_06980 [Anaerolineaceae bacterium]|nr:hypothetical protein [Anaerolineaceae bacterium]